jgi:hypothetical protein
MLGDTGLNAISLVTYPAVEHNFLCFNKETRADLKFDNDKHIISGVFILADTPIYRYNESIGDYYVVFKREVIEKLVEKYSKMGLQNSVNLQHDDNQFINSAVQLESYIKDSKRGIVPVEFADIPDGSWCGSFKIEDDELWNKIKTTNEFNGFSVQGLFELKETTQIEDNMSKVDKPVDELIDDIIKNI